MTLNVWQLDPANLTPYYNLALCAALAEADVAVRYITSRYLYEPNLPTSEQYTLDYHFFRGLDQAWLMRHSRLRKLLRGLSYPLDYQRLLVEMRANPPDVVHLQWSRLPRLDEFFIRRMKAHGLPLIHTIHNVKSSFATPDDILQLGRVYARMDRLILHTEANRRDFLALYPHIASEKTTVIPLINAPSGAEARQVSRGQAREQFQLGAQDFVVLFFGIIRRYKGLALLLDAFEQASVANPSLRLMIAGKAESDQDRMDVARANSMQGVIVDERFIPSEELPGYFAAADVAVFPYQEVTQSAALIQAMNHGKPVIVTDIGGLPEVVDGNGWIVPKDEAQALADAILEATQDQGRLSQMGARSHELIESLYAPPVIAAQHLAVYHAMLDERRA